MADILNLLLVFLLIAFFWGGAFRLGHIYGHRFFKKSRSKKTLSEYNEYFNISSDGFWDWYIQDDYEYMSPRFWEILGFEPHEKKHHPSEWQDLIFKEDLSAIFENFDAHINSKGTIPFKQEIRYRHKNGSTVYIICQGSVIKWDTEGKPLRMIGTHTDITKFKNQENKLHYAQAFQELFMESNPDYVFVKDSDFRITQANSAFLSLYPENMRNYVIGYTTIEAYNDDEAQEFLKYDREAFEKGSSETIEVIAFPDGTERTLFTKKVRFVNANAEKFILGIGRDITERENLMKQITRSNQELERFAFICSHDLQEPLRMMRSFSDKLNNHMEKINLSDEKIKKYLSFITDGAERAQQLINNILLYSRISDEDQGHETFNSQEIIEKIMRDFHLIIEETGSIITHDPLPIVKGHKIQLYQLLNNLIQNSIKYQNIDTKPKIHISVEDQQKYWKFGIKDNGIGIDKAYSKKIFEIFKRLHTHNTYSGTGIGLSICKKIIDHHKGEIWFEPNEDQGVTFYFTLLKLNKSKA